MKPPSEKPRPKPPTIANLDEAAAALDTHPREALAYLERMLAADPSSERAQALRIVALYESAQYDACVEALKACGQQGLPPRKLALKYPRLKQMFDTERTERRLPVDESVWKKHERPQRPPLMGLRRPPARD